MGVRPNRKEIVYTALSDRDSAKPHLPMLNQLVEEINNDFTRVSATIFVAGHDIGSPDSIVPRCQSGSTFKPGDGFSITYLGADGNVKHSRCESTQQGILKVVDFPGDFTSLEALQNAILKAVKAEHAELQRVQQQVDTINQASDQRITDINTSAMVPDAGTLDSVIARPKTNLGVTETFSPPGEFRITYNDGVKQDSATHLQAYMDKDGKVSIMVNNNIVGQYPDLDSARQSIADSVQHNLNVRAINNSGYSGKSDFKAAFTGKKPGDDGTVILRQKGGYPVKGDGSYLFAVTYLGADNQVHHVTAKLSSSGKINISGNEYRSTEDFASALKSSVKEACKIEQKQAQMHDAHHKCADTHGSSSSREPSEDHDYSPPQIQQR